MDLAAIFGSLGGIVLVVGSIIIAGSTLGAFYDKPSVMLVMGGACMAAMTAFPFRTLKTLPFVFKKCFFPKTPNLEPVIAQLVEYAEIARRDGILALENKIGDLDDPFTLMGLQMAIDGTDGEVIEAILRSEMECVSNRHKIGKGMLDTLNKYAPAWGMIGTLVGLVIMLGNMSDPNAIGPGMAVALLTTLYGAIISNMFCSPLGDKLAFFSKKELEVREIVVRGILSIQVGDNPRVLEQKLRTFLPPSARKNEAKAA